MISCPIVEISINADILAVNRSDIVGKWQIPGDMIGSAVHSYISALVDILQKTQ
jgi:hypothetical protein